jgi:hypothetical protein
MQPTQKMRESFNLAEAALILAIEAVDSALSEAIGGDACATEFPDFVVATMEFAGRIYAAKRQEASSIH